MAVSLTRDGDVALVTIDNPPVNATSQAVRAGLMQQLAAANADDKVSAIVLSCAGRTFVAGADVKEFGQPPQPPFLPDIMTAIEASPKPVVAALHGTALGGGLELALASHARVAAADAAFGLPEVKLGIVPGAGGTQRLPRLIGIAAAIDLVSSGRRINAIEASAMGLIDAIADGDLVTAAVAKVRSLVGSEPRRTGALSIPPFDAIAVDAQIEAVEKKARGQKAPGEAAQLVLAAASLSFSNGLAAERARFLALVQSDEAKALRHIFATERLTAKVPGLEAAVPRTVQTVGVVGAGLMGSGITVAFLNAGYTVRVVERDQEAADAGQERIDGLFARLMKSGRLSEAAGIEQRGRLSLFADRSALADCDLVIEAVFDDLDVKKELFADLSRRVRPDTILATNTSYLDPDEIAAVVQKPERFLGLHFFSPATVMRLVEVIRTGSVSNDVLATGLGVVKRLGKLGVASGVCEGFIGNRLFTAYRRECDFMLEDGALPHEIDAALEAYGFAMGPYAVNDLAGLDISWARRKRNAATRDPSKRYVAIADRLCEAGRLGQKVGKGYYAYKDGRRCVDPQVTAIIEAASHQAGIPRRRFAAEQIVTRVLEGIVAEGRKILDEGIALRASDIDLVLVNGYGYPAWRGGPMYQAGIN